MYFNPTASAPKRPFANLRGGLPSPCGADRLVPASRSRLVPAARVSRRPAGNGKAVRGTSPLSSGPRQNNGAHYQPPPNSSPAEPRSPTGAAGVADSPRTTSLKACSKGLLAASAVVFEAPGRAPERIATSVGRSWGVCTRATSSSPPRTLQPRTRTPSPRPQPQSPPKAPEIPMSAAAAAYLALGKAPGESTPSRSERRLRGAGVEQVQQPRPGSARGSATASKDRLAHPMLLNNIGTFGRKLRRSSIVGSGLPPGPATEAAKPLSPPQPGSLSAGRDILERSWSSEEAERRLRAMSSEAATSSTASQEAKQYHAPITSSKPPTSPPQGGKAFRVLRGRRVAQRAPACTIKPHQCVPNSPTLPVDFSSELLCLQNEVWRLKAKVFKSRTDSSRFAPGNLSFDSGELVLRG